MSASALFQTAQDLFEQEKYLEAKVLFEAAKQDPTGASIQSELDLWIRKCYTHLGGAPPPQPVVVVAPAAATLASIAASSSAKVTTSLPSSSATTPKIDWSQTPNDVTLSIFLPNRTLNDVTVELDGRTLTVSIKTGSGKEYQHVIDTLFAAVKGKPTVNPRPSRVEITLTKTAPFEWTTFEAPKAPTQLPPPSMQSEPDTTTTITAPSSSIPSTSSAPPVAPPTTTTSGAAAPPRFEWFQSQSEVTLTYFVKERKPDDVTVVVEDRTVTVTIAAPAAASATPPYVHQMTLFADVQQQTLPKVSVRSMKVEIVLTKTQPFQWATLQAAAGGSAAPTNVVTANASVIPPTAAAEPPAASAKDLKYPNSKGKDWNKVQFNPEDEYKAEGGDAALNALFKQIYSNGSDEQRMAMMKSFQESNGTVLSTNWTDVGSKTVKPEAPRGMVEKKYQE